MRGTTSNLAVLLCAGVYLCYLPPNLQAQTPVAAIRPCAVAGQPHGEDLNIVVGESVLIDCGQSVQRASVGFGEFVEVTAISRTELLLNGRASGETSLIIWGQAGDRQVFHIRIRLSGYESMERLEGIQREFREELPGQALRVRAEDGVIFLSGTAKDLNSANRAAAIASASGKIVNLLHVEIPAAEPQILLKVVFASVDRTKTSQLGINLFSTGLGNVIGGASTGQFAPPSLSLPSSTSSSTANLSSDLNLFAFFPGLNLGASIQALEAKGLVQVLSEPNLLASNGKQASFLAGGEYPYPVVQGTTGGSGSSVSIQFKEYGVRLNFIPTITPRGTIRLQVAPEVSSLDFTNAVEISGFQIPAIDVRSVKTEVELGEGQSFVIGGLLDKRETETFQKIPFLSSIPILGRFFQSISKSKTNTELIVIVTPEIVAPIPVGSPLPRLKYPADFLPPTSGVSVHTPESEPIRTLPPLRPSSMPIEQLMQSIEAETPLIVDSPSQGAQGSTGKSTGVRPSQSGPQ